MDVWAVRVALAAALRTVTSDPALVALEYVPDSNPPLPCAYVQPQDGAYLQTYGDAHEVNFSVVVLVSRTDDKTSQQRLDALLPACRAALEAVELDSGDVSAPRWQGYGWRGQGAEQTPHLGAELVVTVLG